MAKDANGWPARTAGLPPAASRSWIHPSELPDFGALAVERARWRPTWPVTAVAVAILLFGLTGLNAARNAPHPAFVGVHGALASHDIVQPVQ